MKYLKYALGALLFGLFIFDRYIYKEEPLIIEQEVKEEAEKPKKKGGPGAFDWLLFIGAIIISLQYLGIVDIGADGVWLARCHADLYLQRAL